MIERFEEVKGSSQVCCFFFFHFSPLNLYDKLTIFIVAS